MRLKDLKAVVYDIETCDFTNGNGSLDISSQTLTVAITYDEENGYLEWREVDVNNLIEHLLSFDKVIGFNIKGFDNRVLDEYEPGAGAKLDTRSLDMMEIVEKRLGHRVSLNSLVTATLGVSKTANGAFAAQWAKEGDYDKIAEYCTDDVEVTKNLFLHGLKKKEIYYDYHGDKRKIKVDWLNPNNRFDATEYMYVLDDPETGNQLSLDSGNSDFFRALELVRTTNKNLFITGKAGTGKTTFLKYVKSHVSKRTAVVAYTGVAAINAGGQTIHSFFKIDPKAAPFTPWDKRLRKKKPADDSDRTTIYDYFKYNESRREIMRSLDLLIIDEVSMVRADFLDVIDKILRAFSGKDKSQPFGGVQVVLIGDTFQLPPIEGDSWRILREFYESPFFFSAKVVQQTPPLQIELKKIYRQNEIEFINLLNRVRVNQPLTQDISLLNSRVRPLTNRDFEDNYIVLCSTNSQVNHINQNRLVNLVGEEKVFIGEITGTFNESSRVTELYLQLKEGAQVMFLKNGTNYYNGKIGTVVSLDNNKILIQVKNSRGEPSVVRVEKHTWENVVYTYNRETKEIETEVVGTFTQYPLKLAWAITVHKSQGLTFEKVFIDINDFAPSGLTYVALSRCTSFNGLALLQPIQRKAINTDLRVIKYAEEVAPETLVTEILNDGKADELYTSARTSISEGAFDEAYSIFLTALKYRNDIETETFQRYIKHLLKSRKHYQLLTTGLQERLDKLDNQTSIQVKELKNEILDLSLRGGGIQFELDFFKSRFEEKEHELTQHIHLSDCLKQENQKLKEENSNLSQQIQTLKHEKKVLIDDKSSLLKQVVSAAKSADVCEHERTRQKLLIKQLEERVEKGDLENKRLRNITWFEKLLGKK